MREFQFKCPLYVELTKKRKSSKSTKKPKKPKKNYINLNSYRNWQFNKSNNIKKKFKEEIKKGFPKITKPFDKYSLHYEFFLPTKHERDIMNLGSVTDKFANDALVEEGIVEEDNYKHLQDISFTFGGYDSEKEGYCLVTVTEVKKLKDI